jgi:hypothetical protein
LRKAFHHNFYCKLVDLPAKFKGELAQYLSKIFFFYIFLYKKNIKKKKRVTLESIHSDPKDGDLHMYRAKPRETLVEA